MKKFLLLVSVLFFSQNLFSQISLLYPNGGETFIAGITETIRWTANATTSVQIDYSIDNGVSWTTITPATSPDVLFYDWTVPNNLSTTCLVKITDITNGATSDVSDLVFTIADSSPNPITLVTPNGGEYFVAGTTETIRWYATSITYVNLDYSTDNGLSWININSGISSMFPIYNWEIPSTPSASCLVRVSDFNNETNFDLSDGLFTIEENIASTLTLTYPNGGEIFYNGSQQDITWLSSNVGSVNLYFSPDRGLNWYSIASDIPASMGSFTSTVNAASTTNALVRVSDAANAAMFDESDSVFTIIDTTKNTIIVSSPNGGENWQSGSTQYLAWTNTNMTGNVNIDYTTDNGTTWLTVATDLPAMYPSFMWTVPNTPSTSCKIKVYDASDASVFDESNSVFTITTSATGGVVAHYNFNGDANDGTGNGHDGTVNGAQLVADRFSNPNSAYSFPNPSRIAVPHSPELNFAGGKFTFTVWMKQEAGSNAFNCILGKDYTQEFGFGTWGTDGTAPTYPRLFISNHETPSNFLSPLNVGTWYHVAVTFDDATDQVQFFVNGVLNETSTNTGSMTATTTEMGIGSDGKYFDQFSGVLDDIRIFDHVLTSTEIFSIYNDSGILDQVLELETPNGGEYLVAGTTDTIHWFSNYLTQVKLDYTTDYGATWTNIVGSLPAEYPSGYAWTVPSTPSMFCKVRVTDNSNPDAFDESDSAFTIQLFKSGEYASDANTVLLDHFNGTTDANILAYSPTGQPCGSAWPSVTPSYFFNPGMNELYQSLTLNPPIDVIQGSATYLKYPGGQLLSQANGTIEFWVNLTSYGKGLGLVNQGQYFGACYGWTINIDMDSTGTLLSSAWAAFSLNSGSNKVPLNRWTHVAVTWGSTGAKMYIDGVQVGSDVNTGMPAGGYGGSLLLTLGTGSGVSASIDELRVSNIQRTEFHIIPQKFVSVASPNGGENLVAGNLDTIRWISSDANILNIEYSTDNGVNWISIYPAMPASVGSAPWLIPNTPSTSCKVRIADAANPTIFDESDRVFTISDSMSNGLVAYYPFNGNANDESGNGNNGTNNGAVPTFDRFNTPNSALSFDGNNNFVLVPSSSSLNVQNSITLSAWIKTDNPHIIQDVNPGSIIAKHETVQTRQYDLFFYSTNYDSLHFDLVDQRDNFSSDEYFFATSTPSASYRNNQWHMVVGTYDYNTGFSQIYLDGVLTSTRYLGQINLMKSNVPLTIGCYSEQNSNFRGFYQGIIDDIRIYDRSLSQQEIMMLYYEKEYVPISLTLITPIGGEVFQANSLVPIEWSASNVNNFSLEFTSDNGASWSLICDTLTAASTGFLWYAPDIESNMVRVRISDKNNPALFDESNSNFTITNKITQYIPLFYSGWNMISFYIQPLSSIPRDVFPSPLVLQVKTELQSFDPALPEFLNTLKSVYASQGYLVKTDSVEHSFPVIGDHFYPADGINYRTGWNLMSYYYSYGESVWYAFEPIMTSVEEIKTLTSYYNPLGSPETNTLYTLEPGEAYWLRLKNNIDGYVLPSPQAIMPKKHQTTGQKLMADLPWKLKGYPQSTVAIFTVTSDGKPVPAGSVVAAFVNGECRAISEVKLNSEGNAFATLVINGDKEEEVSFKIFDAKKKEAFGSNLKMKTKPGTTIAGIQELPFTFVTGVEDPILPTTTTLMNAYPNPFNPETRIRYSLNKDQHVSLKIYEVLGKEVITLVDDTKNAGYYEASFDASGLPSGIYFYRMQSGEYVSVKKLLLLK